MDNFKDLLISDASAFSACFGYFKAGMADIEAYFDLVFRKTSYGYIIAAGLEEVCAFIDKLRFTDDDTEKLRALGIGDTEFYDYLRRLRFTGEICAVPEGTVVFSGEPVLALRAPICEAVLLESFILYNISHQSAVATRAARLKYAAGDKKLYEAALRREHGEKAAARCSRAAYIGGSDGTSCAYTAAKYGIPAVSVMPHSYVQMFDCEYSAYSSYLKANPVGAVLCVDTYDTVGSGLPALIEAARDTGISKLSVRLDSGDFEHLAKKARDILDGAGLYECKICLSSELDEKRISRLAASGAPIDAFVVGGAFTSEKKNLSSVYKLCAVQKDGKLEPKIKLSENYSKISLPGVKKTVRYYSSDGKALADEVLLEEEPLPMGKHTLFHPEDTWKMKTINNYSARELLIPIYREGVRAYELPDAYAVKSYCESEKRTLASDYTRLDTPSEYPVDYSEELWTLRRRMTGQRRSSFFLR